MPRPSARRTCKRLGCLIFVLFSTLIFFFSIWSIKCSFRKQCILAESRFDFLKDLVMSVPDVQGDGEEGSGSVPCTPTGMAPHQSHPPIFIRSQSEASTASTAGSSSTSARRSSAAGTGRPRGRPRKNPVVTFQTPPGGGGRIRSTPATPTSSRKSRAESDEEEDSDDDEDSDDENDDDEGDEPKHFDAPKGLANGAAAAAAGAGANPSVQFNAVQPNFYQARTFPTERRNC